MVSSDRVVSKRRVTLSEEQIRSHRERAKRHLQYLKVQAQFAIGVECIWCGTDKDVQAAHVIDTGLSGAGRGQAKRCRDIIAHPEVYRPMCREHHLLWDKLRALSAKPSPGDEIPF